MGRKILAALVCAAAVAAVAASGASADAAIECNTTYSNTTLNGGVVVNEGDICILDHVTVNGGLTVNGGTSFNFALLAVDGSTIHGGWSITGDVFQIGPNNGYFCGNNVDGGLNVHDVEAFGSPLSFGELNAGCAGGRINGGATFTNNDAAVELDGYRVNGGLTFLGLPFLFNELEATAVKGSATCENVADDGSSAPLVNSFTGHNNGCPA